MRKKMEFNYLFYAWVLKNSTEHPITIKSDQPTTPTHTHTHTHKHITNILAKKIDDRIQLGTLEIILSKICREHPSKNCLIAFLYKKTKSKIEHEKSSPNDNRTNKLWLTATSQWPMTREQVCMGVWVCVCVWVCRGQWMIKSAKERFISNFGKKPNF